MVVSKVVYVCSEPARLQCTSVGLVSLLLDVISSDDNDEVIQACRALGNLCFDNGIVTLWLKDFFVVF